MRNREKYPFYEHSTVDFFIAVRNGHDSCRIAANINHNYIRYHDAGTAQFYLFASEDDRDVSSTLPNASRNEAIYA